LERGPGVAFELFENYHFDKEVRKEHNYDYAAYFKKMFGFDF